MSPSSIRFKVVVPARYASTRLPGKPLLDLGGKPMVARVVERGQQLVPLRRRLRLSTAGVGCTRLPPITCGSCR